MDLDSSTVQQFLERVTKLTQISIAYEGQQKEIDFLATITKIQNNYLFQKYFIQLDLPSDPEILKSHIDGESLKIEFYDRQFDLTSDLQQHKIKSLNKYYFTLAHHIAKIKRLDLLHNKWNIYMSQLFVQDSSKNSAVSIIFETANFEIIKSMIEYFKNQSEQLQKLFQVTNNRNQNLIHLILINNNLNCEEIQNILEILFVNDQNTKDNLLQQFDSNNNIPLTTYLKKQNKNENQKNIQLVKELLPNILKNKSQEHLNNLEFNLYEFQYLQLVNLPMYVWRVYPMLKLFFNQVDSLNNQIIVSILKLKDQSKEIFDIIGNSLNYALVYNGYEQYLLSNLEQIAEKCLSDQQLLDEKRQADQESGKQKQIIDCIYEKTYLSEKQYYLNFLIQILSLNFEPSSSLDIVVTTKLRLQLNQIETSQNISEIVNKHFDNIFNIYSNKVNFITKLSNLKVFNQDRYEQYYTYSKIAALKNQEYFKIVSQKISNQKDKFDSIFDYKKMRIQVVMLNLSELEDLARFDNAKNKNLTEKEKNELVQTIKNRVKNFRKFNKLIPFIINKIGYYYFLSQLGQKMKKKFFTILAEQFFTENTQINKINDDYIKTKLIYDVIRSESFKKVLESKGINQLNTSLQIAPLNKLMQVCVETIKLSDLEQWNFFKNYYFERKQELKNQLNQEDDELKDHDKKYNDTEYGQIMKIKNQNYINLSNQTNIDYFQVNAKRLIISLIKFDALCDVKLILTSQPSQQLLDQLSQSTSPYLLFFHEMITTCKNEIDILLSNEKYFEILQLIKPEQTSQAKKVKTSLSIALKNNNFQAIQWVLTQLFPQQELEINDEYNQDECTFKFSDLNLHQIYFSNLPFTTELDKELNEKQWKIFQQIYIRFNEQINNEKVNKSIVKLYELFGSKFDPKKLRLEPKQLANDYIVLMMILRKIYLKYGENQIHCNKIINSYYFNQEQIELIVENYLKAVIEQYQAKIKPFHDKNGAEQFEGEKFQIYDIRNKIIMTMDFLLQKLNSHVIQSQCIQEKLLELSRFVIQVDDKEMYSLISQIFCKVILQEQDKFKCVSSFIDEVVYQYELDHQLQYDDQEEKQQINYDHDEFQDKNLYVDKIKAYNKAYQENIRRSQEILSNRKPRWNIYKHIKSQEDDDKMSIIQVKCFDSLAMLINSSLKKNYEGLLLRLLRINSLISYYSKSSIFYLIDFKKKNKDINEFYQLFNCKIPVFLNRYLSTSRFEKLLKIMQEEQNRKFNNNELNKENNKRFKFILENLIKDIARNGQSEKWDILLKIFKPEIFSNFEHILIQSYLSALAGKLSKLTKGSGLNEKKNFLYKKISISIKNQILSYLNQNYCIDDFENKVELSNYTQIIQYILKTLKDKYSNSNEAITLQKISNFSNYHFNPYSIETTLHILFLSSLFHFEETFNLVQYLHKKQIIETNVCLERHEFDSDLSSSQIITNNLSWIKFIRKSVEYGSLKYYSSWTNTELKQFLQEFKEEYITYLNEQCKINNDKSEQQDTNEDFSQCNFLLQNTDSTVVQEYLSFLVQNKDNLNQKCKDRIEILLDLSCRQTIYNFANKSCSRKHILEAMSKFDIKLNNILTFHNVPSMSEYQQMRCLQLDIGFPYIYQTSKCRSNKIYEFMMLLNDEDLEYAIQCNLFSLNDIIITPKFLLQKLQFFQSVEEKESQSLSTELTVGRFAVITGRMPFVKAHQNDILECLRSSSQVLNKPGKCAQEALLLNKFEVFEFFFNMISDKNAQYNFISSEKLLYRMANNFIGSSNIFSYLLQNFYCNKTINSQFGNGNELLSVDQIIKNNCLVFVNLAIMGQEQTLLDIFNYLIKQVSLDKKDIEKLKDALDQRNIYEIANAYDIFSLFQLNHLICFLYEKGFKPTDLKKKEGIYSDFRLNYSKTHQINYLEKQGLLKEVKSESDLYKHLTIVLKFLINELTQFQVDFKALQMLQDVLFSFNYSIHHQKIIYECLKYFGNIQFTGGIYILCEIFKNINLSVLITDKKKIDKLQRSEVFNIYLLKQTIYPEIDIKQVIENNQSYFKNCQMAKFIQQLNTNKIQQSLEYLSQTISVDFQEKSQIQLEGDKKYAQLKLLVQKLYYQKEFIKIICEREKEFLTNDKELFHHIILQDTHLTIFLLKDNPQSENIIKQFEIDIKENKNEFNEFQGVCLATLKHKKQSEFSAAAAAESQSQFTDSPFNKVLRSIVYYFAVQKRNSILEIYDKVFSSINIFSKQGISFYYHLFIIKNAPSTTKEIEQNNTQQDQTNAMIEVESVKKLSQYIIYNQLIKTKENFDKKTIEINFNNIFDDIVQFAKQGANYEQQYSKVFQTIFRFFQTVYSLNLTDSYPEKSLEITLIHGTKDISITEINENGLKVNLYYNYDSQQFNLNADNIQPLIDQVENFYFSDKNIPFIEQQIELFNNHKDKLIPQSQFGEIPFQFIYSQIENLPLEFKKEIMNQVQFRSKEALKNTITQQIQQQNSSIENKKEYSCDTSTYFGLFTLIEDISMFLSFLNIKQKEFYALNDMFAPHNNAMMNPIEQQLHQQPTIQSQQSMEQDQRGSSHMLGSQTMNIGTRMGGGQSNQQRENVLNSIKMQGAIFSYYLEQLPDNTYKVNLRKNNIEMKGPQNQLLFSEFYEFCPFKQGQIQIIYIPYEEYIEKTKTQSIYNTILAQVISYEQHFLCTLKSVKYLIKT